MAATNPSTISKIFIPAEISVIPAAGCRTPRVENSTFRGVTEHDECVIHPNECPYEFVSPLKLNIMSAHPSCNNVASAPIGHCGDTSIGETIDCAITKDACHDPDSFVRSTKTLHNDQNANSDGASCTILQDLNFVGKDLDKTDGLTRYIGCSGRAIGVDGKDHVCVATIPECRELAGYDEGVVITLSDPKCDCSQTKTGACARQSDSILGIDEPQFFCAIDEEVCNKDQGLSYINVNQLMRNSGIDCRLCDASIVKDYRLAVLGTARIPTPSSRPSVGAIVGISIGSTLLSTFLLYCYVRFRQANLATKLSPEPSSPKTTTAADGEEENKQQTSSSANHAAKKDAENAFQENDEDEEIDEKDVKVRQATYV